MVVTFGRHFDSLWPSGFFSVTLGFGPAPADVQCCALRYTSAAGIAKIPKDTFDFYEASIPFIIDFVFKVCRA